MYSEMLDTMLNETKARADKGKPYNFDVSEIEQWFIDRKLIYSGITEVTVVRNEIIDILISKGLNPYWNGLGIEKGSYNLLTMFRENLDEFVAEVKKIKLCIVDGFRFNIIIWDNTSKKYILQHRNIPIQIRNNVLSRMGDDAVQTNANFLISSNIMFRQSQNDKDTYQFENTGSISILDTLDIDLEFLNH